MCLTGAAERDASSASGLSWLGPRWQQQAPRQRPPRLDRRAGRAKRVHWAQGRHPGPPRHARGPHAPARATGWLLPRYAGGAPSWRAALCFAGLLGKVLAGAHLPKMPHGGLGPNFSVPVALSRLSADGMRRCRDDDVRNAGLCGARSQWAAAGFGAATASHNTARQASSSQETQLNRFEVGGRS